MEPNQSNQKENITYTILNIGGLNRWREFVFTNPKVPKTTGKCFLKERINLTGMEVSVNVLVPGEGIPFYHKHLENEELYIFLKGKGQFQVDGEVFDVQEGTVVRVAPEGVRAYRNHSDENLYFIVIQAKVKTCSAVTISDGEGVGMPVRWP